MKILQSRYGEDDPVTFYFNGELEFGTITDGGWNELYRTFIYTIEAEINGELCYINLPETVLIDFSPEHHLCDECLAEFEQEEAETEFKTNNHCLYSIFPDDENEDAVHIEINPDWYWDKEDVWELIGQLLYSVGEMDKEGNLIGIGEEVISNAKITSSDGLSSFDLDNGIISLKIQDDYSEFVTREEFIETVAELETELSLLSNKQNAKPLFIMTTPASVSDETLNRLTEHVKKVLKEADIDAVPLMLADGLHGYFATI